MLGRFDTRVRVHVRFDARVQVRFDAQVQVRFDTRVRVQVRFDTRVHVRFDVRPDTRMRVRVLQSFFTEIAILFASESGFRILALETNFCLVV